MNLGDLLKNMGKIRKDLERVQADLKNRVVEATAGGELVRVHVNGQQELLKVTLSPDAVRSTPDGIEMLEDLILAAVSQGLAKAKKLKSEEIEKVTGGMGGGLGDLL
jgi:nucleoid-associated protein EbfC